MRKSLVNTLRCLLGFAGIVAIQMIVEVGWAFVKTFQLMLKNNTRDTEKIMAQMEKLLSNQQVVMKLIIISSVIAFVVYIIWYRKSYYKKEAQGTMTCGTGIKVAIVVVAAIGLQLLTTGIVNLAYLGKPEMFTDYQRMLQESDLTGNVVNILYVLLLAPITEELVFRGVTFGEAKKHFPLLLANLIQASFFGIYHGNAIQGINAFAIGLVFGILLQVTGKLIYSIVAHIIYNAASIGIAMLPDNMLMRAPALSAIAAAGVILLLACYVYGQKRIVKNGQS